MLNSLRNEKELKRSFTLNTSNQQPLASEEKIEKLKDEDIS